MSDQEHWSSQAACLGQWDLFDSTDPEDREKAVDLCGTCPVRLNCLQDALDGQTRFGVRGGVKELDLRITQSINSKGETHVYPGRKVRCEFCKRGSTKFLSVLERRRTKTHVICDEDKGGCGLKWWTRKVINKKATNF